VGGGFRNSKFGKGRLRRVLALPEEAKNENGMDLN